MSDKYENPLCKRYSSCVGEGPFTAEMFGEEAAILREAGAEYGAATGRPRRVGGFDVPASRYDIKTQGANELALTKLDVHSYMDKIPVCVAYEVDGVRTDVFPSGDKLMNAKVKKVYVNEKWCLGCHMCEYYCAFAETNEKDMARALKDVKINPRIKIEEHDGISFAVSCRHCKKPLCVKSCITGALTISEGVITINKEKCVGCYTCILVCPFGAVSSSDNGAIQKCELCIKTQSGIDGIPACVKGCPNGAIVFEERG